MAREFIWWIIIRLIAGWVAGRIMKGGGYGVFADITLGILGGILGGWIVSLLGFGPGGMTWSILEEPFSGPDSHETGRGPRGNLLRDWGGERPRLPERGVNFDFPSISDSRWNLKSEQKERLASWNRFRGTIPSAGHAVISAGEWF